jgi:hypothetical protein
MPKKGPMAQGWEKTFPRYGKAFSRSLAKRIRSGQPGCRLKEAPRILQSLASARRGSGCKAAGPTPTIEKGP